MKATKLKGLWGYLGGYLGTKDIYRSRAHPQLSRHALHPGKSCGQL